MKNMENKYLTKNCKKTELLLHAHGSDVEDVITGKDETRHKIQELKYQ